MAALLLAPCPVCASGDADQVATAEDIRAEVEALWAFHGRRLRPDTPPDRLADRVAFSQAPPLHLVRCARCGLVYRNPRERGEAIERLYASETVDRDAMEALFDNQRRAHAAQAERLTRILGRTGHGLELGSYVGGFLAAAHRAGWRFEGVDINPHVNAAVRARGFHVVDGGLEDIDHRRRYDAVAIWNCFDQLPDPRATARQARALLPVGGVLALRVPNGAFYGALRPHLQGRLAPVARALLAHNNLLAFPYRHGFTPRTLRYLLARTGFAVERVVGDTLVPVADEWTRGWAALEERLVKGVLRSVAHAGRLGAGAAPWVEVYARAVERANHREEPSS